MSKLRTRIYGIGQDNFIHFPYLHNVLLFYPAGSCLIILFILVFKSNLLDSPYIQLVMDCITNLDGKILDGNYSKFKLLDYRSKSVHNICGFVPHDMHHNILLFSTIVHSFQSKSSAHFVNKRMLDKGVLGKAFYIH